MPEMTAECHWYKTRSLFLSPREYVTAGSFTNMTDWPGGRRLLLGSKRGSLLCRSEVSHGGSRPGPPNYSA